MTRDNPNEIACLIGLNMRIKAKPGQRIRLTVPRRTTRGELQYFARQLAYYVGIGPKPEGPAATTERMDLMRPDALTKAFAERGLTLASRSMAEVDLEDDGLPVGVAVNAPTPDATQHPKGARESTEGATTAALLAYDGIVTTKRVLRRARLDSIAHDLAAALRAEREKGKKLEHPVQMRTENYDAAQDERYRLQERLAAFEALAAKAVKQRDFPEAQEEIGTWWNETVAINEALAALASDDAKGAT